MLKIRQFTFNPVQENTYVIFNDKGACAIIDPGCYFDYEYKELTDFIDTNKLLPNYLLNTHCHLDHVFGNKTIAEKYGLVLHMHRLEKELLDYAYPRLQRGQDAEYRPRSGSPQESCWQCLPKQMQIVPNR